MGMVVMGGCREILGSGTLFSGASLLLGPHFTFMELTVIPEYRGFLLMMLPPGGFVMMGLLLAGKRLMQQVTAKKPVVVEEQVGGCHV